MARMREERIGAQRLILGNCREVMPEMAGRFDAIVSDPPYGMGWNTDTFRFSGGKRKCRRHGRLHRPIAGDDQPFDPSPFLAYPAVLWGANHYFGGLPVGRTLVWIKKSPKLWGTFLSDAEIAWASGGHGVYCKQVEWSPPARAIDRGGDVRCPSSVHPTQKPVAVMEWCLGFVPLAQCILDPYMGSGTTLVACQRLGRSGIGIEIDPEYFEVACRRVDAEAAQPRLELPPVPVPSQMEML